MRTGQVVRVRGASGMLSGARADWEDYKDPLGASWFQTYGQNGPSGGPTTWDFEDESYFDGTDEMVAVRNGIYIVTAAPNLGGQEYGAGASGLIHFSIVKNSSEVLARRTVAGINAASFGYIDMQPVSYVGPLEKDDRVGLLYENSLAGADTYGGLFDVWLFIAYIAPWTPPAEG